MRVSCAAPGCQLPRAVLDDCVALAHPLVVRQAADRTRVPVGLGVCELGVDAGTVGAALLAAERARGA